MTCSPPSPKCILIFEEPERPDRDGSAGVSTSGLEDLQDLHESAASGCSTLIAYRENPEGVHAVQKDRPGAPFWLSDTALDTH